MNHSISIIIPVYNRQKELLLSLESIKKQTYRPIEVVVIDDGSVERIKNQESRIKNIGFEVIGEEEIQENRKIQEIGGIPLVIFRQKNKGAPAARNKGFELSQGEYVIFWDADVVGVPEMIEKMSVTLTKNPKVSFVYGNHVLGWKKIRALPFLAEKLKENNFIPTMSLMRRNDFPGWDESLKRWQDWDLWLTLAEQGKQGIWIDEYLYHNIPTQGGMSAWLPSFAYHCPWKFLPFFKNKVRAYEETKRVVLKKHQLL